MLHNFYRFGIFSVLFNLLLDQKIIIDNNKIFIDKVNLNGYLINNTTYFYVWNRLFGEYFLSTYALNKNFNSNISNNYSFFHF